MNQVLRTLRDLFLVILLGAVAFHVALSARDAYLRSERCAQGWALVEELQQRLEMRNQALQQLADAWQDTDNPLERAVRGAQLEQALGQLSKANEADEEALLRLVETLQRYCGEVRPTIGEPVSRAPDDQGPAGDG